MASSATAPLAYRSGDVIDERYRLLRPLEEGGMSWIWLAQHMRLDTRVAVKIVSPESDEPIEDPLREARITARLRHPSIVTVIDSGFTVLGDAYLVMEYLEGSSLSNVLRRDRRMPARDAVALMLPVLDALKLCHDNGVVHRDIKPANLFLARERGRAALKLLDFGVAKTSDSCEPSGRLTGTPGYMAPEQVYGLDDVDARADVWAMCAVLYEAVSGSPAIAGRCWQAVLVATPYTEVAPLEERGDGEAALWKILEIGLHGQRESRYHNAGLLRDALAQWLDATASVRKHPASAWAKAAATTPTAAPPGPQRDSGVRTNPQRGRRRRPVQWGMSLPAQRGVAGLMLGITALVSILLSACTDSRDPVPVDGGSGGGGDAAAGDELRACVTNSDCVLVPTVCCPCGTGTQTNVTAVHRDHADAFWKEQCPPPTACPTIACETPPRRFVPSCRAGECTAIDLGMSPATACNTASDCRIRSFECCECGGSIEPGALIARSDERSYSALVCDPAQACDDCLPIYPREVTAECGAQGHCTLDDPRGRF